MKKIDKKELLTKSVMDASNIVLLGFLWLLCSFPIISIGASTTSLYSAMIQYLNGDNPKVMNAFFDAFKANWKQSTKCWLVHLLIIVIFAVDMVYYSLMTENYLAITSWIMGTLMLIELYLIQFSFPYLACVESDWKYTFRMAILYFKRYPLVMLITSIIFIALVGIALFTIPFILVFLMGLVAFINSKFFMGVFSEPLEDETPRFKIKKED